MVDNTGKMRKRIIKIAMLMVAVGIIAYGGHFAYKKYFVDKSKSYDWYSNVQEYAGKPYAIVNDNNPFFSDEEREKGEFIEFGKVDSYGRSDYAFANLSISMMPSADVERKVGSNAIPPGFVEKSYDFVDQKKLYNRCHLIGWQLSGLGYELENLMTGTRFFNVNGMLPFENRVANYIKKSNNHVLYRVTPVYEGSELVARGALMEAYSLEDEGEGITFCVYVYNVEPGVVIDYKTGESRLANDDEIIGVEEAEFIANTNTKRFHYNWCDSVNDMSEKNKMEWFGTAKELVEMGYKACGKCKPK